MPMPNAALDGAADTLPPLNHAAILLSLSSSPASSRSVTEARGGCNLIIFIHEIAFASGLLLCVSDLPDRPQPNQQVNLTNHKPSPGWIPQYQGYHGTTVPRIPSIAMPKRPEQLGLGLNRALDRVESLDLNHHRRH
jgi:hypothetical protein